MKYLVAIIILVFLSPFASYSQVNNGDVNIERLEVNSGTVTSKNKLSQDSPKLEFLWETDSLLTTVESVIYDEKNELIYSSNIEWSPGKKDGQGSISKINLNGNIVKRDWIKDLDAPKGLGIYNGLLYVTDIDQVHQINIEQGEIVKSFDIEGAKFLNDIAISSTGRVYFSDTDINKIFYIENDQVHEFMDFDSPNGLYVQDNDLLVVSWGKKTFNRVDIKTKVVKQITDDIHNPDGIVHLGNNRFLVSSWGGMVHQVNPDGSKIVLLDTREAKVFAADIEYISDKNILLVPNFFHNTVRAYQYSYE